jgi:hypothetical protein
MKFGCLLTLHIRLDLVEQTCSSSSSSVAQLQYQMTDRGVKHDELVRRVVALERSSFKKW